MILQLAIAFSCLALACATDAAEAPFAGAPAPRSESAREQAALSRFVRLGIPIRCGGAESRVVALTFDDGPGPYTPLAIRILRHADARATFFLVGRNLADWPALPRRERALGAVGDHTWTHAYLSALTPSAVAWQLRQTQVAVARASGSRVELFRPPYGARTAAVDPEAHALGMLEVLWSVDTRDAEGAPWYAIANDVSRALRPGAIVLMHENHGQTIEALKFRILPELRRLRFRTVSVPELLAVDPPRQAQLREGYAGCARPALRRAARPSRRALPPRYADAR